ncbi:MAG: hypothetical protein NTX87_07550 [Planctomycetota bacterium]|nr:hypothetical protein [Planctomycetota bacterium]
MFLRHELSLLLLSGLLLWPAGAARADILNPSFETGGFTGWTALASWTVLSDGGSQGERYASVQSPGPPPVWGPWTPPDENQGWATAIEQVFWMPLWAETLSIDVRTGGLTLIVHLSQEGVLPFEPVNMMDGTTCQAPNGFTRYTVNVSEYAGLTVRLTVNVGADEIPLNDLRADVDNVHIVPEPGTFGLIAACMGAVYIRSQWAQGQGVTS